MDLSGSSEVSQADVSASVTDAPGKPAQGKPALSGAEGAKAAKPDRDTDSKSVKPIVYPVEVEAFSVDRDLQGATAPAPDQLEVVELQPLRGQVVVGEFPQFDLYTHPSSFLRRHGRTGIHSNKVGQTPTSCEKTGFSWQAPIISVGRADAERI